MCCNPERGEMHTLNWKTGLRARLCVVIVCRDSLSNESQLPVPSRTGKHGPARVNAFPTPAPVLFLPTTRQYYLLSSRASPSLPRSLTLSPSSLSPFLPAHTSHTIDACARCIILEIPLQLAHSSTLHHFSQHPSLLQTALVQQQRHAKRLTTFEHSPAIRITTTQPPS